MICDYFCDSNNWVLYERDNYLECGKRRMKKIDQECVCVKVHLSFMKIPADREIERKRERIIKKTD